MSRLLFVLVVFAAILGAGYLALNASPQLPSFIADTFPFLGSGPARPYLEKFNGQWLSQVVPAQAQSDVITCPAGVGTLTLRNGTLSGTVPVDNSYFAVHGSVDWAGALSGTLSEAAGNSGTLSGSLSGASGSLVWSDSADCKGSITLRKLDPIVDPAQGHVYSIVGDVVLRRPGAADQTPVPQESLYAGDVIVVPPNGEADLVIGPGAQALQVVGGVSGATYAVPNGPTLPSAGN